MHGQIIFVLVLDCTSVSVVLLPPDARLAIDLFIDTGASDEHVHICCQHPNVGP